MRSLLMLLIGCAIGGAVTLAGLTLTGGAYVQRAIRDETSIEDIRRWIERDNCSPVDVGGRLIYYRCPRFRL